MSSCTPLLFIHSRFKEMKLIDILSGSWEVWIGQYFKNLDQTENRSQTPLRRLNGSIGLFYKLPRKCTYFLPQP
jgi:hypothetical protein